MKHIKKFDNLNEDFVPKDFKFDGEEIVYKNDKKYEIQVNNQMFYLSSNNANDASVRALQKYIGQYDKNDTIARYDIRAKLIK